MLSEFFLLGIILQVDAKNNYEFSIVNAKILSFRGPAGRGISSLSCGQSATQLWPLSADREAAEENNNLRCPAMGNGYLMLHTLITLERWALIAEVANVADWQFLYRAWVYALDFRTLNMTLFRIPSQLGGMCKNPRF